MKIAITDYTFADLEIEAGILRPAGHEITAWREKRSPEELCQLVADADAVITQFAPVNAAVVAAMRQARVIVRYGVGVDNVDLDAARAKGIPVCNVPDYCIDEVADHTLAFILAATRQIVPNHQWIRRGNWGLAVPLSQMKVLRDLTVGVVGFGRLGREVAARLRPFKCRLLANDPVVSEAAIGAAGCEPATLDRVLAESDIVTLHCPSTSQTRRLLNRETLGRMKPGAIVVNLARGDLIETAALVDRLQSGCLGGAALDVCDPEPIPGNSPLRSLNNVISSSHNASASVKAARTLRETATRIAVAALRGELLPNVVNGVQPQG